MKGLPQTLVHNFHFEFLERPQLIPFVRAKVSLCFYDDLLTRQAWLLVFLFSSCWLCVVSSSCCFVLFYGGQGIRQLSKKLQ